MKKDSPFYCYKKNCRKTIWDTPEYITPEDISFAKRVIKLFKKGDIEKLYCFMFAPVNRKNVINFFNRVLGWPEGYMYSKAPSYFILTFWIMLERDMQRFDNLAILK